MKGTGTRKDKIEGSKSLQIFTFVDPYFQIKTHIWQTLFPVAVPLIPVLIQDKVLGWASCLILQNQEFVLLKIIIDILFHKLYTIMVCHHVSFQISRSSCYIVTFITWEL